MNSFSSLLQENRVFSPHEDFSSKANISSFPQYDELRNKANSNILNHWNEQAMNLHWFTPWDTILNWNYPTAQWFTEGTINASYNSLDIHLQTANRNKKGFYLQYN